MLSWAECVEQLVRANPELRAAEQSFEAAQLAARGAYGNFWPQLSASLNYSTGAVTTGSGVVLGQNQQNYAATISASQNLFNGMQDKAKVAQAAAQAQLVEANLSVTRAKLTYDLKSAYAGLLFAQRSIRLQETISRRREDNLKLVSLRFESGRENKGSVLLSKAYLNQARFEALQAKNGFAVAQAQLARVLGKDEETVLRVGEEIPLDTPPQSPEFRSLVQLTPEHRQAVAREQSADAGIEAARAGFFPTVGLTASTGRAGADWFPQTHRWSVGANLSFPLFSGGRDYYGTRSAAAEAVAASANRENADRQQLAKLKQAHASYIEAIEKLEVDRSFREAALKRAEISRTKYNNGLMTFEDWDLIENDLIVRERAVLQSERNQVLAEADWALARGKGVIQ
jgi:outer membrane protein TolC